LARPADFFMRRSFFEQDESVRSEPETLLPGIGFFSDEGAEAESIPFKACREQVFNRGSGREACPWNRPFQRVGGPWHAGCFTVSHTKRNQSSGAEPLDHLAKKKSLCFNTL
jgi:hypothetical protein